MPDAGSRIIAALEAMWKDVQARHDEVPNVVLITGTATQGKRMRWGHHWPERWQLAESTGATAEMFIAGELLAQGAARVLQTMLHEGSHSLADIRGIKDTSRSGNRYHNAKFAALAREMGLEPPETPSSALGYSACTITEATVQEYAETIRALDEAKVGHLRAVLPEPAVKGAARAGQRVPVACGCVPARKIQITPKQIEQGALMCGVCGDVFSPVNQ
ncbi:hypothetical protein Ssi03_13020 [Sphaerisporangium siamense]|uniref:SprT-like domain-containing protein n=1 Tax=Sphaerisporangium siamense TaxID=795645 RepID=A0A7W7D9U6_9ACTN|nr:hypothetical protein [Sphaerisporangium siamense]MBB4702929.1 hypothetical protein [Sphaerisporangium siamense]GII83312.1 hypothetical protein Ssi03_13020 [Sphaerisporangium siamense]